MAKKDIRNSPGEEEEVDPFLLAETLLLGGDFSAAASLASEYSEARFYALRGILAWLDGEEEGRALELYDEGLKRLRKEEGARKVTFNTFSGLFHPLLLLAREQHKKATAVLSTGIEKSRFASVYTLFRLVADFCAGRGSDRLFSIYTPDLCENPSWPKWFAVFVALAVYWTDADRLEEYRPCLLKTLKSLEENGGVPLLAAELADLLEVTPARPVPRRRSLASLLPRKEEWMHALSALDELGRGAKTSEKKRRLIWECDWEQDEMGRLQSVDFSPIEQVLQASGKWSRGRAVALKRLRNELVREDWLTKQDVAAAGAVEEAGGYDGWYYKRWYEFNPGKLVKVLAGHPCLFRRGEEWPVEIVLEEPRLEIEKKRGGYRVKLVPSSSSASFSGIVVTEEGPNRLKAVSFEEKHLSLLPLLGEEGLFVPKEGQEILFNTVKSLAALLPVTSEQNAEDLDTTRTEPDSRISVQLAPSGEGFSISLAVRPLGPGTPPCRPGKGGATLLALVDGRRISTLRNLEEERQRASEISLLCPALAEGEQQGEFHWMLDIPEAALELLLQLSALGDSVVLEWPKGGAVRVRASAGMDGVRASVRSGRDWFALSGEIALDEKTVLSLREASELLASGTGRFLPLGEGEFLAVTEDLRKRLEDLRALGDWKGEELRFSPLSALLLEKFQTTSGTFSGDDDWEKQRSLVEEARTITPLLPPTFRGELREYQKEGFDWLVRLAHMRAGACLADDMGLGKTIQILALLLLRAPHGPALVAAPTSVCPNWLLEAARFAPTLNLREYRPGSRKDILDGLGPFDVVVASYGMLQRKEGPLQKISWHTVVLDEAQAIKNSGTKRSAAAMNLTGDFRIIATGTPMENHPGELWNLFRFLNPGLLGSKESFNRRFATPIVKNDDRNARARLRKILRPFLLRRTKDQVLSELPPKTEITLRVEMDPEERGLYEAVRRNALSRISSGQGGEDQRFVILAELMKLRRVCCSPSLLFPEKNFPSAKLKAFGEILNDLLENGHRCLVFSQFVDHLSILRAYLDGKGISYAYLDGSTPSEERKRQVASFQAGEKSCFLISLRAGGTGLNLTAADYVIHMDPWWNPAVEDQASDRVHRIGQERPVTVYRIVAKDTIEEKIVDLHAFKRDLAESLLEGTDRIHRFSLEEMASLIREDSPRRDN